MKKLLLCCCAALFAANASAQPAYEPSPENLAARQRFADGRFGIFLHWGLYALLGQGEWVMTHQNIDYREYEKLAGAFCPAAFDAGAVHQDGVLAAHHGPVRQCDSAAGLWLRRRALRHAHGLLGSRALLPLPGLLRREGVQDRALALATNRKQRRIWNV